MPTENRSSNTEMVSVPRALAERISNICMFTMYKEDWRALSEILAQPAEQLQGEPVPITSDMHRLMEAYRLGEFTAEGGSNTIESLAVESFDAVANHGHDADSYMAGFCASLYWQAAPFIGLALKPVTHADPAEVERLRDELEIVKNNDLKWLGLREQEAEIENLRTQLAERDALLREIRRKPGLFSGDFILRLDEILSANAEPSAPTEEDYCPDGIVEAAIHGQIVKFPSAPIEIDERHKGCCCPPKGYNGVWAAGPCPVRQGLRKLGQARAALERKPS